MAETFTAKEKAEIRGIHIGSTTKAMEWLPKAAKLWRRDNWKFLAMLEAAVVELERLEPMPEIEIERRIAMSVGKLDREIVHPRGSSPSSS